MLALLRAANTAFQRNRALQKMYFYPYDKAKNPLIIVSLSTQENRICFR